MEIDSDKYNSIWGWSWHSACFTRKIESCSQDISHCGKHLYLERWGFVITSPIVSVVNGCDTGETFLSSRPNIMNIKQRKDITSYLIWYYVCKLYKRKEMKQNWQTLRYLYKGRLIDTNSKTDFIIKPYTIVCQNTSSSSF